MNNQKGVTVLELIIVLAFLGFIIATSFNFINFGQVVHSLTVSEAEIQSSSRLISEHVNQVTRYSTVAYTVPKSSFQDLDHRDSSWSYVGINKEGHVVIDEPGDATDDPRKVTIVAEKQDTIDYEVEFHRAYLSDGTLSDTITGFSIKGFKDGRQVSEIISQTEVLNALQVEHRGSKNDPAVALAFTTFERGSPEFIQIAPDAHIAMVLDLSGSMTADLNGLNSGKPRYQKLVEALDHMIVKLSSMSFDIYVSLVPFSTNANNPYDFKNVNCDTELQELQAIVSDIENNIGGWTNTGDGIRRAYYQLEDAENQFSIDNPDKGDNDFTQHMMILVDGATNRETREITSYSSFFGWRWITGSKLTINNSDNTTSSIDVGNIFVESVPTNNNDYIHDLGNQLITQNTYTNDEGETVQRINTFVIGFSNLDDDLVSLDDIGEAMNAKEFESNGETNKFIEARDADELNFAFETFSDVVHDGLWSISGPSLNGN